MAGSPLIDFSTTNNENFDFTAGLTGSCDSQKQKGPL